MKKHTDTIIGGVFIACIAIVVFALSFQNFVMLRTRAAEKTILLTLTLQGERQLTSRAKVKIILYSYGGFNKTIDNVELAYQQNKTFQGAVPLDATFDYSKPYALFVKPVNYLGKAFCSETVSGTDCTTPQFIFSAGGSSVNLSKTMLLAGDTKPGDGKVDAGDMSRIIANLGKPAGDGSTDMNNDGITDVTDYSLAFYSLSLSIKDDTVNLTGTAPTPTGAPTTAPSPTGAATPTLSPTPSPTGAPTATPTPTPSPTPQTSSSSSSSATAGKCHGSEPAIAGGGTFDVVSGQSTTCECQMGVCAKMTCANCKTGTCDCGTIPAQMPPINQNCTGGASISIVTCTQ